MESAKEIWKRALGELQIQVSKANYVTWLSNSRGISYHDNILVVSVPNTFVAEWLSNRLHSLVKKTLANIIEGDVAVQFVVHNQDQLQASPLVYAHQTDGGTSSKATRNKFNPKYTLDSFVVGGCNRLAYAAAVEVTENQGHTYNPLFIHSSVGQGKTHLLHAIGHVAESNGLRVVYTNGEQFTNAFILAVRQKQVEDFRNKFKSLQMLLFDDMRFISDKKQTQQCFLHIFSELYNNNCQIVLAADHSPKDMPLLSNKLRSLLECGLTVSIEPPAFKTRLAILRAKARGSMPPIPDDSSQLLAKKVHQNVRQLEGALTYLSAQAKLSGTNISPQMVNNLLTNIGGKENKKPIIHIVADYFNLSPEELIGKQRTKNLVVARQITMYLMREKTHRSFAEIAKELGNRNHATILHGYKKISNEININAQLRHQILEIKRKLNPDESSAE